MVVPPKAPQSGPAVLYDAATGDITMYLHVSTGDTNDGAGILKLEN